MGNLDLETKREALALAVCRSTNGSTTRPRACTLYAHYHSRVPVDGKAQAETFECVSLNEGAAHRDVTDRA